MRDTDGRSWWTLVDPYCGLSTRTRHPETSLYLANGTELLVTVGYVRGPRGRDFGARRLGDPCAVQRIVITLRGAQQRARLERRRADLVSTVAHELRSPLTSVKGFTATLLAKWTPGPAVRLAWCRVHNGEFQQPRRSDWGVEYDPTAGIPDLSFAGRVADSLYLSVSIPAASGFRYDMVPDTATDFQNLVIPAAPFGPPPPAPLRPRSPPLLGRRC